VALLDVKDLRTRFRSDEGEVRAVDGVSLQVDRGEAVGLVGESGCGKTVTALSVMGLVPEPAGRILPGSSIQLDGRELIGLAPRQLRRLRGRRMAMIFQEPMSSLNPVYTVGSQLQEALVLHRGMGRKEARTEGVALLGEVGIGEPGRRFDEYPHQLSGGMRQRVMVAMALCSEPDLLIADEPSTALDVTIQAQILDLLADLRKRRGMALLLITHDLGVVAEVCDRVVVMYAGEVVEEGAVTEIFRAPQHPYTRGLLGSLPRLGDRRGRLRPIPGSVPSPLRWPQGCRFRERCPHAWDRCADEAPPLLPVEGGGEPGAPRTSRCWLQVEPERELRGGAGGGP
jgi:peptide/nickel transport system ATP-binding protein